MENGNLALLIDFENLIIGLESIETDSSKTFSSREIINFLENNYGRVCYKKAFADWSNLKFRKYAIEMMKSGIEMQHILRNGYSSKSHIEMHIVIQALDCVMRNKEIDTVVLCTGDADFLPLIGHLKSIGKKVIGLGTEGTVAGALLNNCDKFVLCSAQGLYEHSCDTIDKTAVIRALRNIIGSNGIYVEDVEEALKSDFPEFNLFDLGYNDIYSFLESISNLTRIESSDQGDKVFWNQQPQTRQSSQRQFRSQRQDNSNEDVANLPLAEYMAQTRWFISDGELREAILTNIYNILAEPGTLLTSETLRDRATDELFVEDKPWQGTIFSLVCGSCLWEKPDTSDMPLHLRKLSLFKNVRNLEDFMIGYYTSLFHKAFMERSDINAETMAELMHPEDVEGHLNLFEKVYADMSDTK